MPRWDMLDVQMLRSGSVAIAIASVLLLLVAAMPARAEGPRCEVPVIHRHATSLPANAPGFLIDAGAGGRVTSVRVVQTDLNKTIPVTVVEGFARFDAPIEPYTHLAVEIRDDCAASERAASYSLDVGPEAPVPTSLGALTVGAQIEGLIPLGGVAGARVDESGWEPVGVFRETALRVPPEVLRFDALLAVEFVYDGDAAAPWPPEPSLVDEPHRSVVHARCDGRARSAGIGEGAHRVEAIGTFAGMDLELRAGPADVRLECTSAARSAVEGHRQAIANRPWAEAFRFLRSIRQDTFAILVLVSFAWAAIRWKRKRAKNWPFAPD